MMHKERIWDIKEYNSQMADYLAEELNISPMVTGILLERGLQDAASMRDFLYGSATPFHDPFLLKDMQRSVERIERALAVGSGVGVTSGAALLPQAHSVSNSMTASSIAAVRLCFIFTPHFCMFRGWIYRDYIKKILIIVEN